MASSVAEPPGTTTASNAEANTVDPPAGEAVVAEPEPIAVLGLAADPADSRIAAARHTTNLRVRR